MFQSEVSESSRITSMELVITVSRSLLFNAFAMKTAVVLGSRMMWSPSSIRPATSFAIFCFPPGLFFFRTWNGISRLVVSFRTAPP